MVLGERTYQTCRTVNSEEEEEKENQISLILKKLDTIIYHLSITEQLNRIENLIMTVNEGQIHLDKDVAELTTALNTAVAELKAQIAAGVPAPALNFTALDALVTSTAAEAVSDAPPVVTPVTPPVV